MIQLPIFKKFQSFGISIEIMGKINQESVAKIEEEPNEEMLLVSTIKS